jgi:hypothetical protein
LIPPASSLLTTVNPKHQIYLLCRAKEEWSPGESSAKRKNQNEVKGSHCGKEKILTKNHTLPTSKAAGSFIAKSSNFSAEEDNMLAKAFVNIYTNPIHRSGMKSNDFWDMRHKRKELLKTEGTGRYTMHSSMALKLQFQHQIQKDMNQ